MMRRRGTGTIEMAPDGRFVPRLPGRNGKRLEPCSTREEAERDLEEAGRLIRERLVHPEGMTLADFVEGFLERREGTHANARDDRNTWNACVADADFCGRPLSALTPPQIREWRDDLLARKARPGRGHRTKPGRKLSRRRAQNALNLLRVCLEDAVERGLIPTNPAKGVTLPRALGLTFDPWTYLLPEEQDRLLGCEAIPEDDRDLYGFAIGEGMRESEMWNLHLRDLRGVRLADGVVEIDPDAVIVVRFGGHGKSTKGKRIREVPIFDLGRRALERWLPKLASRPNPHRLVWPLRGGERRADGDMPRHWYRHLGLAGIVVVRPEAGNPVEAADCSAPDRHDGMVPTFHDGGRHTCGARLVSGWTGRRWSLQEVQKLLGHRSVTTTERYASLAKSALQAAAAETDAARVDLPKMSPGLAAVAAASTRNHSAPPRRLERPTNGLGNRTFPERSRQDDPSPGEIVGTSGAAILRAVADGGEGCAGRVAGLAAGLLDGPASPVGRRILAAIAEGGPGAWRKVTEAAAELLEQHADATGTGRRASS
jgi:integrase